MSAFPESGRSDGQKLGEIRVRFRPGTVVEVKDFLLQNQMEPLCFPVTPQKNYAKDQKHCSDSNVCLISVKEYGRDDHQQARK